MEIYQWFVNESFIICDLGSHPLLFLVGLSVWCLPSMIKSFFHFSKCGLFYYVINVPHFLDLHTCIDVV